MNDKYQKLLDAAIGQWLKKIDQYPGWRKFQNNKIGYTFWDDWPISKDNVPVEFNFPDEIEKQREVVVSYLSLSSSLIALKDVEYYFRRYPFHSLPITKHAHLRYICEMYFNRFYEFLERIKTCLNLVNLSINNRELDVGMLLKTFDKEFDQEIRARHSINHRDRFEDLVIDQIAILGIIGHKKSDSRWTLEYETQYRKASREWAERVKKRAVFVENFQETIAQAVFENCSYLNAIKIDNREAL